jgi:hyperosmotically inducible periplasmic protein
MKTLVLATMLAVGAASVTAYADDTETPKTFVKDSVITTKVKSKLAAKHMSTLAHIKVDTDANGVVWLSGKAPTKDAADLAELTAKDTDGVVKVHNKIIVAE